MAFPTGVDWYSSSQSGISFRRWVVWRHENIAKFLREVADGCSAQSSDCLIVVEVTKRSDLLFCLLLFLFCFSSDAFLLGGYDGLS